MSLKHLTLFAALLCTTAVSAALPMQSGKAPFAAGKNEKMYPGDAVFDRDTLTWNYGRKQLKIGGDGTVYVLSAGRQLARIYFFIATPYKYYQLNTGGTKKSGEYEGKRLEVRDIRFDKNGVTVSGLIPWNKAGDELLAGPWSITVTPNGKGRFSFYYTFDVPTGKKLLDRGIFMAVDNIREMDASPVGIWFPKKKNKLHSFKPTVLKFAGNLPEDDFSMESSSWSTQGDRLRFFFRFGKNKNVPSFVIDLGKSQVKKTVKKQGGVDFQETDLLTVPERGRNLLPNPYFAGRAKFFLPAEEVNMTDDIKFSTDAKFGRYSLDYPGWNFLATVPAEAGDYVLSFYAKGKGTAGISFFSAGRDGSNKRFSVYRQCHVNSPDEWKRYEVTFHFPMNNGLASQLRLPKGVKLDGLQLEKGKHATSFEAPAVEACSIGNFFFESGKPVNLKFDFSTLEKQVSGKCMLSIRNFFGEETYRKEFDYSLSAGKYPEMEFPLGNIPDGIYVVKMDYGKTAPVQFFRFSVMPFLKNTHKTARVFSTEYASATYLTQYSDRRLARLQAIGYGCYGHASPMTKEIREKFDKYKILPFDVNFTSRCNSKWMKRLFPELKNIPPGRTWSYIRDASLPWYHKKQGRLPDYRLVGGWTPEYRKKFIAEIARQVRLYPQSFAYRFGSEWSNDIKDDPHYIDLYMAYREAVKSVYPNAYVYEAGDCNMEVSGGVASYDRLLTRMQGKTKTDFASAHPYVKDVRHLYPNFRAFVEMLKKHKGYEKCRMAFGEGMHVYPYYIPAWNMEHVCWMGEGWNGSTMTYDLGWSEKLSAAYHARAWLVYLTEFDRVWCATAAISNSRNSILDDDLTPRASQKIPNTLGVLLGNPKRYLGDCTFAPDTKCLVWEDEKGRPLAAVWCEDSAVNSGCKDAPKAKLAYRGAEYIDLMGVTRKPAVDGEFPVTPFPLFIRGKAGDCKNFVKAISTVVLEDPGKLPCRIGFELKSDEALKLTLINPLARPLDGTLKIFGRDYRLSIPKTGEQSIDIKLPQKIRKGRLEKLVFPYQCIIDGRTVKQNLELNCFAVPRFNRDWKKIPAIRLTNFRWRNPRKGKFTDQDFSVSYQLAWDEKKMYLRVNVKDDVFSPGNTPGYRWDYDVVQVYFDTRCSAMKTGRKTYDDDDYDYGLMPTEDGKRCEVWRAFSPDIQLTLGTAAPKNNTMAPEIPAKFTRTADGYIYEAEFPAMYLLPLKLTTGYNFAFGIYAGDKDKGKGTEKGLSNTTVPGTGCYNQPHLWPIAVLAE